MPHRPRLFAARFLCFLGCLTAPFVHAAGPGLVPVPSGVWQGTLGHHAVVVCFDSHEASYYYVHRLAGIRLIERAAEGDAPPSWAESSDSQPTGSWAIDTPHSTQRLSGRWASPDGAKVLPIRLTRVKTAAGSCSLPPVYGEGEDMARGVSDAAALSPFLAFNAARIAAARQRTTPATFDGRPYLKVEALGSVGFELPAQAPQAAAVNAVTRHWLKQQVGNAYECELGLRTQTPRPPTEPVWERDLTPIHWTPRWLVLQDQLPDVFCGGAHSTTETRFFVFDLSIGMPIDPARWFTQTKDAYGSSRFSEGLLALVQKANLAQRPPGDATCESGYAIQPYPSRRGMSFLLSYPHVIRVCDMDVDIPYAHLRPHLSRSGIEAVRSLSSSLNTSP